MFINYFKVNGIKYDTGTVFITNYMGKHVEASFMYYDTEQKRYVYKIKDCTYYDTHTLFWRKFVSVTNKMDNTIHLPVIKRKKEFEIDGLFIGWVWYIFLMGISIIFKDAIGLWIIISIVFFNWRSKKIKEEGTYIER